MLGSFVARHTKQQVVITSPGDGNGMKESHSFNGLCEVTDFVWVSPPQASADLDATDGDINNSRSRNHASSPEWGWYISVLDRGATFSPLWIHG